MICRLGATDRRFSSKNEENAIIIRLDSTSKNFVPQKNSWLIGIVFPGNCKRSFENKSFDVRPLWQRRCQRFILLILLFGQLPALFADMAEWIGLAMIVAEMLTAVFGNFFKDIRLESLCGWAGNKTAKKTAGTTGTLQKQQEIFFCCSLYFESYVHIPAEFHPIISYNITPDCIFSRCRNTKACTDEICNNAPYHLRFSRRGTMVTRADVSRIREVTKRSFRSLTKAPVRRKIEPYAPARSEIRVRNRNPPWYDRAQKTCHPTRTCNLYECGIR